jgi:hypothetical protein
MLKDLIASRLSAKPSPKAGGPEGGHREPDLLAYLHKQFDRVVRDPMQLAGHASWEGGPEPQAAEATSLVEMGPQAGPFDAVGDTLLPGKPVQRLIEGMEPFGPDNVPNVGPVEEVLRLFAPELARGLRTALPSLTRREHHGLSPDSPMHLGTVRHVDTDNKPDNEPDNETK